MTRITELLRGPMRDRPRERAGEKTKMVGIRRPCVVQAF